MQLRMGQPDFPLRQPAVQWRRRGIAQRPVAECGASCTTAQAGAAAAAYRALPIAESSPLLRFCKLSHPLRTLSNSDGDFRCLTCGWRSPSRWSTSARFALLQKHIWASQLAAAPTCAARGQAAGRQHISVGGAANAEPRERRAAGTGHRSSAARCRVAGRIGAAGGGDGGSGGRPGRQCRSGGAARRRGRSQAHGGG